MTTEAVPTSSYFEEEDTDNASNAVNSTTPSSVSKKLDLSKFAFSPKPSRPNETLSPSLRRSSRTLALAPISPKPQSPSLKRKTSSNLSTPYSPSPTKKPNSPSGYTAPEVYAHLPLLPDAIEPNLICLFIGLNPGVKTAETGHAYSHPSNLFWKLLHKSGCTTRLCRPEEDRELPELFALGHTNIVARPSRNGAELSKAEMDAGVTILEEKIRTFRPEAAVIVGKSIWESVWRVKHEKSIKKDEFKYGWQDEGENMGKLSGGDESWAGATVFVASSTSGLAATLLPSEKERIWGELGSWVKRRREERTAGNMEAV